MLTEATPPANPAPSAEATQAPSDPEGQRRANRAAYMRDYRAGGVKGARKSAERQPVDPSAPRKPTPDELRNLELALTGTIDAATEAFRLLVLDSDAPVFGEPRAAALAKLWLPVVAAKIETMEDIAELVRYGATAGIALSYAREVVAHKATKKRTKPPVPAAALASVVSIRQEPQPVAAATGGES